ncbi:MAG TPA: ribosome maturation factor RimP [Stellaceae bacterium]|jgi:ribosome maturation factor RimP|nr:ribosome maturation factor RimP [Stellaceae bacterium]
MAESLFDAGHIETMIAPSLEAMGYDVVRVSFTGGRRPTLQIMVEHRDDSPMTVEDCATVSHSVSALLDVADPIATAYHLEVSSPGIDRPLVRRADYERFAGFEAKIELQRPLDGRRRFRGTLMGLDGDSVKLRIDDASVLLPLSAIARAKLVLNDALIAETQPQNRS